MHSLARIVDTYRSNSRQADYSRVLSMYVKVNFTLVTVLLKHIYHKYNVKLICGL